MICIGSDWCSAPAGFAQLEHKTRMLSQPIVTLPEAIGLVEEFNGPKMIFLFLS